MKTVADTEIVQGEWTECSGTLPARLREANLTLKIQPNTRSHTFTHAIRMHSEAAEQNDSEQLQSINARNSYCDKAILFSFYEIIERMSKVRLLDKESGWELKLSRAVKYLWFCSKYWIVYSQSCSNNTGFKTTMYMFTLMTEATFLGEPYL